MDDKQIIDLYINQKKGVPEISKLSGYHTWTIYDTLKNNGIKIRTISEAKCISSKGKYLYDIIPDKIYCSAHNEYEIRSNFNLSWIKLVENDKRSSAVCKLSLSLKHAKYRILALTKIAVSHNIPIKCQDCEVIKITLLDITHNNSHFGSNPEIREIYNGLPEAFYKAIINEERNTQDLTIKCKKHNILDEYINGFRDVSGWNYKYHIQALHIIANNNHVEYKCQRCGETDERCFTIEHTNGGGHKEMVKLNGSYHFYQQIILGERDTKDLSILCPNCQKESWDEMRNFK